MNLKGLEHFKDPNKVVAPVVEMDDKEKKIEDFVALRVKQMQDYRKELKIEDKWKEADKEYIPSELDFNKPSGRRRFETDQETGLRSRLVPIGDASQDWRSNNSDPTLLSKIQTALSIIIDQNPEAHLKAISRKYKDRTALAYGMWKRNWNISESKEKYKLFSFNLAKYGWAVGRSYPHIVKFEKEILTEVNREDPSKNGYETRTTTWYNDVDKEILDPFRTWVDEQSRPYDQYSRNDIYYEKDYSYDAAMVEFGSYPNFKKWITGPRDLRVDYSEDKSDSGEEDGKKDRQDLITIGFYENRLRDLMVIRIPRLKAVIHYCALPNDDGLLSVWDAPWVLRSNNSPYGISLWEIIKQKKTLYDKMMNMTMDQLVLSIMKMFFYTGTNNLIGDGKIKIEPGKGVQIINGKVDWMDVPGPGNDAFDGMQFLKNGMDDDSGVTPTLQGQVTGQTLGETQIAKEAALKRMKIPVDNIAYAIEQDAYLSLSWMAQIYSTPEVQEFADLKDIAAYQAENSMKPANITPMGGFDEAGAAVGPFQATSYRELNLPLKQEGGKLVESQEERFFAIGDDKEDIPVDQLFWRGVFKVEPKSIVAQSQALDRQSIKEVLNIIAPLLAIPGGEQIYAKPVKEFLISQEMDPIAWLPETWLQFLQQDEQSLFVQVPMMQQPGMPPAGPGMGQVPTNQTSMQGAQGTTPNQGAPTVVPQAQVATPKAPGVNKAPRQELTRAQ